MITKIYFRGSCLDDTDEFEQSCYYDLIGSKDKVFKITAKDAMMLFNVCLTEKEFAERMRKHMDAVIYPMTIEDKIFESVMYESYYIFKKQKRDNEISIFYEKLYADLRERIDAQNIWYECWIDLEEMLYYGNNFETYASMPYDVALDVAAKFLNDREHYYDSSDYISDLDHMIGNI